MFDSGGLNAKTTARLDRFLQPGEKLLVSERMRRTTTQAEWIGGLCGLLFGLLGAVAGSWIGRSIAEQAGTGSLGHRCRCDEGFIVITDRSLRLVKRGFLGSVGNQVAEIPISWLRSMEVVESKKQVHLHFSDGSLRSFKLTNRRVLPYLQSLRPWIESTHRAAMQPAVLPDAWEAGAPSPDLTMAEAW